MNKKIITLALMFCTTIKAELMTVQHLKDLLNSGHAGEVAAVSYVNGAVDGLLAMDSLNNKEKNIPLEFCKLHEAGKSGNPLIKHPAYRTREIVEEWERLKEPMNFLAIDLVLSYLTSQYSCD